MTTHANNFSVDIIIPSHNRAGFICQALDSILWQTIKPARAIVIDDGSTDNTRNLVASYLPLFQQKGIVLSYIFQNKRGVSSARNLGIAHSTSAYILFLDSDDMIRPTYISEFMKFYSNNPADIAYTSLEIIDDKGNVVKNHPELKDFENHQQNIFNDLLRDNLFIRNAAQVLFPRRIIANGLRFDESLTYAEDLDFLLKIAANNSFVFLNNELFLYRLHASNVCRDKTYVFRESIRFYKLWIDRGAGQSITNLWGKYLLYRIILRFPHLDFYKIADASLADLKYKMALFPRFSGNIIWNSVWSFADYAWRSIVTGSFVKDVRRYIYTRKKYFK